MIVTKNETIAVEDGGVDRRKLLKGAVAAGVGVVAWSSPSISSLGGTPAYAAVCTGGSTKWFIGSRNTDCGGCQSGGTSYVRYKQLQGDCGSETFLPPADIKKVPTVWTPPGSNRTVTMNWTDSGNCSPEIGGDARVTISAPLDPNADTLEYCVIRIEITTGQCGNVTGSRALVTDSVPLGGGIVDMPLVSCTGLPNKTFTSAYLVCADDPACLSVSTAP